MPNDDLGQFPTPNTDQPQPDLQTDPQNDTTQMQPEPPVADSTVIEDINTPPTDQISDEPFSTPPDTDTLEQTPESLQESPPDLQPTFEETPAEIPSVASVPPESEPVPETFASPGPEYVTPEPLPVSPPPPPPAEVPAELPARKSTFGPVLIIILLLLAGVGLAASVILFSRSQQLGQQLLEITQTLEQQRTIVTPIPTPPTEEPPIATTTPTLTITPEATITAAITPTISPTPTSTVSAETPMPLVDSSRVLRIALNHEPNAQLILIKTDSASDPQTATTKYFFRENLTTKRYFYIQVFGNNEPEIVDKAIYVTPDNNIPSLNDHVLANTLGNDLDKVLETSISRCESGLCQTATVKAQYIKSGTNLIWQLSFAPADTSKNTLVIQLNAITQEVLYTSPGF